MLAECIALMMEVWNPYGSQTVELVGGAGAMRDKKGNVVAESLLKNDHWEFKIGFRPPIWCHTDGDEVTLSKYSGSYETMNQKFEAPPTTQE
jgi:hypothetical protein